MGVYESAPVLTSSHLPSMSLLSWIADVVDTVEDVGKLAKAWKTIYTFVHRQYYHMIFCDSWFFGLSAHAHILLLKRMVEDGIDSTTVARQLVSFLPSMKSHTLDQEQFRDVYALLVGFDMRGIPSIIPLGCICTILNDMVGDADLLSHPLQWQIVDRLIEHRESRAVHTGYLASTLQNVYTYLCTHHDLFDDISFECCVNATCMLLRHFRPEFYPAGIAQLPDAVATRIDELTRRSMTTEYSGPELISRLCKRT